MNLINDLSFLYLFSFLWKINDFSQELTEDQANCFAFILDIKS